jgi:hypothetical protein
MKVNSQKSRSSAEDFFHEVSAVKPRRLQSKQRPTKETGVINIGKLRGRVESLPNDRSPFAGVSIVFSGGRPNSRHEETGCEEECRLLQLRRGSTQRVSRAHDSFVHARHSAIPEFDPQVGIHLPSHLNPIPRYILVLRSTH